MDLNSRLFDRIRIKPRRAAAETPAPTTTTRCDFPGCAAEGEFRAPKGREREGEYFCFCKDHVREYNATYDYFRGMDDESLAKFRQAEVIGHRPTWKMGANGAKAKGKTGDIDLEGMADPFSVLGELNGRGKGRPGPGAGFETKPETRKIFNAERKALQVMGLGADATIETVKAKYKMLVKQHHPDANGGDRSTEDRLIEIIKAYNYLKTVVRGA